MSYRCTSCGYQSSKWMGFCPQCKVTDALEEVARTSKRASTSAPVPLSKVGESPPERLRIGISEFDRVLGGGLVAGGVILVGGEPGVGKSTLLSQAAGNLVMQGAKVLIATAEESADQVGMRAERLGIKSDDILLLAEGDVDAIIAAAEQLRPDLLIVDSIQALAAAEVSAASGSVGQVRECSARLIRFAKETGTATIVVGHITKDGSIAGPKLLEHMVDVVLYLEGETDRGYRTLHSLKNRFGATHLVGLFEMDEDGMSEVADPSAAFVADWQGSVAGTVVYPSISGKRALLVEVQALVGKPVAAPQQLRRSVRGVESARVHQLLAVLERHAMLRFSDREVYVSVVGGMRLTEPAADLAIALALASSLTNRPLGRMAAWGEVGLTGELRSVSHDGRRLEEAARLGIETSIHADLVSRRIESALAAAGLFND
ncbi:MAG: DNA repair protein RadA [Acidimicrobiia bacterium]|nr:DNA repair protein RadA [Acidimicrobiia bacterium]MDH5503329.1 DNA repair protein RadA [Acidimicrobiia bacterium]